MSNVVYDPYETFIGMLPHHDTVVLRLEGCGETVFTTEEIHQAILCRMDSAKQKYQKALDWADYLCKKMKEYNADGYEELDEIAGEYMEWRKKIVAVDMPKEVKTKGMSMDGNWVIECPECGIVMEGMRRTANYCSNCGQVLRWSD